MRYSRILLLVLSVSFHCAASFAEYSTDYLLRMTIESLSYDVGADVASVRGVGKITRNDTQGLIIARRAAINDARRGLLILKRGILEGKPLSPESVSGNVPSLEILSEETRDGLYFVDIEVSLSELLDDDSRNSNINSGTNFKE